jgi:hypothetical protein
LSCYIWHINHQNSKHTKSRTSAKRTDIVRLGLFANDLVEKASVVTETYNQDHRDQYRQQYRRRRDHDRFSAIVVIRLSFDFSSNVSAFSVLLINAWSGQLFASNQRSLGIRRK